MFPFLTIFLVFIIILNYSIRKQKNAQADAEHNFWAREFSANNTRRQDISKLDYITIPAEKIPQNLHTDSEKTLVRLSSCKMLNLSGQTNTDLKIEYGVANLEALSEYDSNFTEFTAALAVYAQELIDSGQKDAARELLEFAVHHRADSRTIFVTLAKLYQESGEKEKIHELLEIGESFGTLSGRMIVQSLSELEETQSLP